MKYKTLHEKYSTDVRETPQYCMGLGKSEIQGVVRHKAFFGDFMHDYITHLAFPEDSNDWCETTALMSRLLTVNIIFNSCGNILISWLGPEMPSLCKEYS